MTARRALLSGFAAMAAASAARGQTGDSATLLIPGPETGGFAVFATRTAAGLARHMPHAVALRIEAIGGPDGVTVANRFATTDAPDGRSMLLLTGAAAHARLVGETRVRFEPSGWLPVVALAEPVWLVGRGGRPDAPSRSAGGPVRVAIGAPDQAEAVAVFTLDLLGVPALPVPGLGPEAAEAAFQAGRVDALLLAGPAPGARAAVLGAEPWVRYDAVVDNAPPAFADLAGQVPASLRAAGQAAAGGLRTRAMVLLPALTPSDAAAAWRRAGMRFAEEETRETGARILGPVEAAALFATICPAPEAITVWRDWAHRRLGVRPT